MYPTFHLLVPQNAVPDPPLTRYLSPPKRWRRTLHPFHLPSFQSFLLLRRTRTQTKENKTTTVSVSAGVLRYFCGKRWGPTQCTTIVPHPSILWWTTLSRFPNDRRPLDQTLFRSVKHMTAHTIQQPLRQRSLLRHQRAQSRRRHSKRPTRRWC